MWRARTKTDLIIEVWEKLDCENVGADEIMAIESVVGDQFGKSAVDSPMRIARILADEGADLRHAEIMELWIDRRSDVPHGAEFRNLSKFSNLSEALSTLRNYENLRRRFLKDGDKEGMRLIREEALSAKKEILERKGSDTKSTVERSEMTEWITIWLQSPDVFENWVGLRQNSPEFVSKFGRIAVEKKRPGFHRA